MSKLIVCTAIGVFSAYGVLSAIKAGLFGANTIKLKSTTFTNIIEYNDKVACEIREPVICILRTDERFCTNYEIQYSEGKNMSNINIRSIKPVRIYKNDELIHLSGNKWFNL